MRIGIGLPATIPGTPGKLVLDWAREADAGPFSSLGVLDRLLFDNFEPLVTLSAVAAITERIGLVAAIVIAPLRNAAILAKQAASIGALSGGRLTLGVGLGARKDDYDVAGAQYRSRGRRLTEGLATMRLQWEDSTVGPHTDIRPQVLVGGSGGLAAMRMARYADGYVHAGGPPRAFARAAAEARAAWSDLGRPGEPRLLGMAYYQLGDDGFEGAEYLKEYYAFTGAFADRIAAGLLTDTGALTEFVQGYEEAGCDELLLYPAVARMEQLYRLQDAVGGAGAISSLP